MERPRRFSVLRIAPTGVHRAITLQPIPLSWAYGFVLVDPVVSAGLGQLEPFGND